MMVFDTRAPRRLVRFTMAACAIAAAGAGCKRGGDKPPATPVSPAAVKTTILVTTAPAVRKSISDTALITGSLGSLNDVVVGIKNAGKIVAVYAREGDHVKAGQPVAQQDQTDLNSQIAQMRGNLRAAQTRLDQARTAYAGAQTNLKLTDATTRSAVDQAMASLKSAQDSLVLLRRGARIQELEEAQRTVDSAQGDLESAKADQSQAVSDLKRYQGLHDARAISDQQLDQAKTVKVSADARVKSAQARLDSAREAQSLLKEGAQVEDINRSQAMVDAAAEALKTAQSNRATVELRRADVETARSTIETNRAAVAVAAAQLGVAEQALRDSIIRSPIDGVVAERKVEPGMQLAITKPDVMRIVSLKTMFFDGQLTQSQYSEVSIGMPVSVTSDAIPGKTLRGQIARIFPVASSNARSFTVRVTIPNDNEKLRPQMFARGRITLGTHSRALVVPREAVIEMHEGGGVQRGGVFVVENGRAAHRNVTLGYTNVVEDEVLNGVSPGDPVIVVGQAQIQDGDPVKASSPSSP